MEKRKQGQEIIGNPGMGSEKACLPKQSHPSWTFELDSIVWRRKLSPRTEVSHRGWCSGVFEGTL